MKNHKFESLDGLRGLLALSIAAYHFKVLWHGFDTSLLNASYLAVDFFFVLSGFVITHASSCKLDTAKDGLVFAIRRLGRIWPLHVLVIIGLFCNEIFKMLVMMGTGIIPNEPPFGGQNTLATLPYNLLLLHGVGVMDDLTWNGPSWSIGSEFYTYLLFAVAFIWGKRAFAAIAATFVAVCVTLIALWAPTMDTSFDYGFLRCVAGFFTGYFVYRLWLVSPGKLPYANGVEAASVLFVIVFTMLYHDTKLSILAPFVMAIPVWVLAHQQGWISNWLKLGWMQKLGLWSYGIYMVHTLVLVGVSQALTVIEKITDIAFKSQVTLANGEQKEIINIFSPWLNDMLMLVYLAAVVATAALAYRFVENPARNYFNGLARKLT